MRVFLKIFLLLFTVGILPLSGLGLFMSFHVEKAIKAQTNQLLFDFAHEIGADVERSVSEAYRGVSFLATNPVITAPGASAAEIQAELVKTQQFHPIVKDITLLDHEGQIISSVNFAFRGSLKETSWFQNAVTGQRTLADVHVVLYPYDHVLTAAIPVYNEAGQVSRVVICDLSLDYLLKLIGSIQIGDSVKVHILNQQGFYVAASDRSLLLKKIQERAVVEILQGARLNFWGGVLGSELMVIHPLDRHENFPLNWFIQIIRPVDEAYLLVTEVRQAIYLTLGLCLVVVCFLSGLLGRQISSRINKLLAGNRALSAGDFSVIITDPRHDEIGELSRAYEVVRTELGSTRQMLLHYSQNLEGLVAERTRELNMAHSKLIASAHTAGMAEVATGVLHNIGNINTTINATNERLIAGLKMLPAATLFDALALMEEHKESLALFLTEDSRGQKILPYMTLLLTEQNRQIEALLADAFALSGNLAHVNDIIRLQQHYARGSLAVMERCRFEELVRDAMRILDASFRKRAIKIDSNFAYNQEFPVSRSQLIQVVVNLLKNAVESFDGLVQTERRLVLEEKLIIDEPSGQEMIAFSVADNGVGFGPESALKIFNYGFTTKEKSSGSGYGLHFCANYLQSIGGNLLAHSDGLAAGATFTILYPLEPKIREVLDQPGEKT